MREVLAALELEAVNSGSWSGDAGWSRDERAPLIDSVNPSNNRAHRARARLDRR